MKMSDPGTRQRRNELHAVQITAKGERPLLTTSLVARQKGVCSQTVRVWAMSGKLPYIKTASGMRLFRPEDVEALPE